MSKDKVFLSTVCIFVYDFEYHGSAGTLWYTRGSKNLLRFI